MNGLIIFIYSIYGLLIGSFVNAFVWRFRQTHDDDGNLLKLSSKKRQALSIMRGRSMCPECSHQLSATDLIPVVSWLWLTGKCRYCRSPISMQYPVVELTLAALFGISYIFWPHSHSSAGYVALASFLVIVTGFLMLSIYDIKWYLLPDKIMFPLFIPTLILVGSLAILSDNAWPTLTGSIFGALCVGGTFGLLFMISDGKWIGAGDVKLGIMLGLVAGGAIEAALLIFISSFLGIIVSLPFMIKNGLNLKLKIPYGPMLMAACYIVFMFGERMLDWYMGVLQF